MVKVITVDELKELMKLQADLQIIDVRNDDKLADGVIPGSKHIRSDTVPARLAEIDKSRPVYVQCVLGIKSIEVAVFLEANGYDAYSLEGGYQSWADEEGGLRFN